MPALATLLRCLSTVCASPKERICALAAEATATDAETRIRALTYGIQRARRQRWKGQWEGHPSYTIQDVMARV